MFAEYPPARRACSAGLVPHTALNNFANSDPMTLKITTELVHNVLKKFWKIHNGGIFATADTGLPKFTYLGHLQGVRRGRKGVRDTPDFFSR